MQVPEGDNSKERGVFGEGEDGLEANHNLQAVLKLIFHNYWIHSPEPKKT